MTTNAPKLVPIAHWHVPLHWDLRELSLIFYGREGKKVTSYDIATTIEFLEIIRPGFERKEVFPDYEI